jgi:basic membrane protein A
MRRARYVRWALALAALGALIVAGTAGVGSAKPNKTITMAFVYDGPKNDGGWTQGHDTGRQVMEKALKGQVKTTYIESVPYGKQMQDVWQQLIARKVNAIVDDTAAGPPFLAFCKKHPEIACATSYPPLPNQPSNMTNFYVDHWDGSYLAGVAAGMLTKKGVLGYVAPFKVPTVNANLNAFVLGCQSVRKDCTVKTVLVNSWYNPPKEHDAAQTLLNAGVDIMNGLTDDTAFNTLASKHGIFNIGSYQDAKPSAGAWWLTGVVWDWRKFYTDYATGLLNGTWKARTVVEPLGIGSGITPWGPHVPANVKAAVAKVQAKMKAGYTPFKGPIYDQAGKLRVKAGQTLPPSFLLNSWTWLVKGITSS